MCILIGIVSALKLISVLVMIYSSVYIITHWKVLKEKERALLMYERRHEYYNKKPTVAANYIEDFKEAQSKTIELTREVQDMQAADHLHQKILVVASLSLAIVEALSMIISWIEDFCNFKILLVGLGCVIIIMGVVLSLLMMSGLWRSKN